MSLVKKKNNPPIIQWYPFFCFLNILTFLAHTQNSTCSAFSVLSVLIRGTSHWTWRGGGKGGVIYLSEFLEEAWWQPSRHNSFSSSVMAKLNNSINHVRASLLLSIVSLREFVRVSVASFYFPMVLNSDAAFNISSVWCKHWLGVGILNMKINACII